MKSLSDHREEFLKQAKEFDTGKKEEDFHSYLRHHNLDHLYLSETQKQNRQMASNSLNGMGLVSGVAIPLTLGAIFGIQKLTSNIIGHGPSDFNYDEYRSLLNYEEPIIEGGRIPEVSNSLSGINQRNMPMADAHIGQDLYYRAGFSPYPSGYVPSKAEAVRNAVNIANVVLEDNKPSGLFPPTRN